MPDEIITLAEEFVEEIIQCKEYKEFTDANNRLKNNDNSIELINKFNRKQRDLKYNGYSEDKLNELKEIQKKIHDDEVIQHFVKTQNEIVNLLRETNNIISEEIDSPFAFAKGGGCCG